MKSLSIRIGLLFLIFCSWSVNAQQVEVITTNEQRNSFENKSYIVVKSITFSNGFHVSAAQNGSWYAKVHPNAVPDTSPNAEQNFVRSEIVNIPGVTNETQVRNLGLSDKTTAYNYLNGSGSTLQSVSVASSPGSRDVIQASYLDTYGRASKQYLPYTAGGTVGSYRTNVFSEIEGFYNNGSDKIADDTRPYSEVVFDNSPLGRITQSTSVGSSWASHPVTNALKINDAGIVRVWEISNGLPVSTATYDAGTLSITESQDEENTITRTYTNFIGQTVLTEVQAPNNTWAKTYYVYNEYGNPLFIIPPAASSMLSPDAAFAERWYYQYEYDTYQHSVGFKAPGTGWAYTIFDQWDRPVLSQSTSQREKSIPEWSFVKYDDLNRPIVTGVLATAESRASLTSALATFSGRYETRDNSSTGYTLYKTYPTTVTENDLMSISYFDNYSFLSNAGWDAGNKSFLFVPESGYSGTVFNTVLDLSTGSKVKILGTSEWLNSVVYYDNHYRPLQAISENHFGVLDRVTNEYNQFTGQVLKTKSVHNNALSQTFSIQERYSYDGQDRLLKVYHQVNSQPEIILSALEYNELSQIIDKKIHSTDNGATWLQSLNYRYNIQGWSTNINQVPADAGDPTSYYGMELAYNTSQSGNSPRYDGAITGVRFKHDISTKERVFNYNYDQGALTSSSYKVNNTLNTQVNVLNENVQYDLNGNIQTLNRNGGGADATSIDQLTYNYGSNSGNQLMKVTDTSGSQQGFSDGNTTGDDYEYYSSGALKKDKNKGISLITYNQLELPQRIDFSTTGEYIINTYDAGGTKLSQTLYNSSNLVQSKTDYSGEYIYVNGQPQLIFHGEGRLVSPSYANLISTTSTREANTLEGFTANGNVTLTSETINSQTYVKAVANQSGNLGIYPIGNAINVKAQESYSFKIFGYQSVGTKASLYVTDQSGNALLWPGATVSVGAGNEGTIASSSFIIPAGVTQIKVGVLWNGAASGNTVYINRVAVYKTDWEYQYFMNDHLGSPRVVLQTAPHTNVYTATMESQNYATNGAVLGESAQFNNLNSGNEIVFTAANATPGGSRAYVMNSTYHTGPGRSFKVLPGDVIDASVMAYYAAGGSYSKTGLTSMGTAVASALSAGVTGAVDGLARAYNLTGNGDYPGLLLSPDQGSGRPSAFINYILFDETFTPLEAKSQPVGNNAGVLHQVILPTISVQQTGFLYVYLSYDNNTGADVYFDELKITYQESPVIQVNNYYAYGLTAFNWTREGENDNRFLFQGKELISATGWQDFGARMYYGDLGRWLSADPANQFASPYLGMGNNPIIGVDPDGRFWHIVIGAAVGAVYNTVTNAGNIHNPGDFFKYAGVGLAAGAAGAATGNMALAGAIVGGGNAAIGGGNVTQILAGTFVGAAAGYVGGAVGGKASQFLAGQNIGGFVGNFLSGAAGGATGGFVGGGVGTLAQGGTPSQALSASGRGALWGGITGGIGAGVIGLINTAKYNSSNPSSRVNMWTERSVALGRSPWSLSNTPKGTITPLDPIMTQFGNNKPIEIDYNAVYGKIQNHAFSSGHVKGGINILGSKNYATTEALLKIEQALPMLREGDNIIFTRINNNVVTVKANVANGVVRSGNLFMGTTFGGDGKGAAFIYLSDF